MDALPTARPLPSYKFKASIVNVYDNPVGGGSLALLRKISEFARSPQGRQVIAKGKKAAQDPENQRKLQKLRARMTKKR